ncbi:uncharacterized protein LAESUDRAFT_721993 [Laetiporus sulphureus 93-53]|uniref:RED-like N-terminal domain-containing protein n=1 Tax=Laetiporus sulphureus 93-53 TaxID=1314785 RepID=A0A165G520_9APHY|nr:uncharacterized protein LAESUDRAFT_721993 [Laetiporus sulphureus 93-53]KZT09840.1 hypothetical protein LAESUDRAFT_721993 [Laetiporus sulphureus 93-53]
MDQESFRKFLQTPKATGSNTSTSRGSLLAAAAIKSKQKAVEAGQPAFKPRTVKKKPQGLQPYRDRAAERRLGLDGDYAQVEALAEDFERKNAENADRQAVEEQRRYLGGDSDHSVLVKGLDYALFEQNRARVSASAAAEDDSSLEQAYLEASASVPKKRTREEIVLELKAKRAKGTTASEDTEKKVAASDASLEEAKKAGKFRPIGFKSTGELNEKSRKKKVKRTAVKEKDDGTKKRKADVPDAETPSIPSTAAPEAGPSESAPALPPPVAKPEHEPEPFDEDFNIFADAGEYIGVEMGDDDESEDEAQSDENDKHNDQTKEQPHSRGQWFAIEEGERSPSLTEVPVEPSPLEATHPEHAPPPAVLSDHEEGQEEEEQQPMRLQPLASSVLPSIKELLEMDAAAGKAGKRRAKKEKNKEKRGAGEGKVDKEKIERDYKRLKAYTDKKAAAGGA